ncbi:MAG: hypothetical protein BWK80_19090 [Desulfobacteraceae bacterium IS3]|nr:MAG: hypothetical protein BWK80_19090 [Desulfobacteraceae bacterium IS3]
MCNFFYRKGRKGRKALRYFALSLRNFAVKFFTAKDTKGAKLCAIFVNFVSFVVKFFTASDLCS